MSGRTHLLTGALMGALVAKAAGQPAWQEAVTAAAVGALMPDLDVPTGSIWRIASPALAAAALWLWTTGPWPWARLVAWACLALAVAGRWVVHSVLSHRGPLHSLLACLLVWALASAWTGEARAVALAAGYASHLLLDALTPAGVPLAWPAGGRVRLVVVPEWAVLAGLAGAAVLFWVR